MNIIETNILDIDKSNIDTAKITLAKKIINKVTPMFDEVYTSKKASINNLKQNINQKKLKVKEEKSKLEIMISNYMRKQKIKKLLERLSKLVTSGIVNDGLLRKDTIILLKIIDKLPNDKLDEQLRLTMTNITKRFGKKL